MNLHLWFGLTGGIVILVVCLSGTLYVYNTELTEWASPGLYQVQERGSSRVPVEQLVAQVERNSGGRATSINLPADPEKSVIVYTKKAAEKSRLGTAWFVNPYTGAIQGSGEDEGKMKEFMKDMFSLHRWLLFDRIEQPIIKGVENRELGRYITGTATLLFTLGCITGLIIWFPNKLWNWRQGLKIRASGNWKRTNHDLHNTLAFYSFIFLLIMGLTGPQWSFEWYRTGLQKTLGTYKNPAKNAQNARISSGTSREESGAMDKLTVALEDVLQSTNNELAYKGNVRITFPEPGDRTYAVTKTRTGFFAPAAGDKLSIHAGTGELMKKEIFRQKPFNERIAGSIKALHIGSVFGGFTKLLYFLSCLIATSLPVTGTLIWVNKLKKKAGKKTRPRLAVAPGQPVAV